MSTTAEQIRLARLILSCHAKEQSTATDAARLAELVIIDYTQSLISDAAEAIETIDPDELETYAKTRGTK